VTRYLAELYLHDGDREAPVGSFEFVGRFEEKGWKLAGIMVPIAYTAWSLWLVVAGVVVFIA